MIKVLLGALLMTTTALAQTAPKAAQAASTKSTVGSMNSTARTGQPMSGSATRPMRPLPQPSLKEKNESGDRAIPSYKQEKDAGVHKGIKYRYPPRRTSSGARKDTLIDRRKQ